MSKIADKVIGVLGGKGGTGKTTIAIALALALSEHYRTGLVDIDISSHNIDNELGGGVTAVGDFLIPAKFNNLEYVYYRSSEKSQITWAGKDYADVAEQLLYRTKWSNPQYIVVDFPPGTEEIVQRMVKHIDCAIIVYVPHPFSISNANRVLELCRDEEVPVAGAIRNMAYFECPECGARHRLFGNERLDEVPTICDIPFVKPSAKEIAKYIKVDRVLMAVENPVRLKKKITLKSKLIEMFLKLAGDLT